jgi:hypothetical protein
VEGPNSIKFFLEKYKKLTPPDDSVRTEFARVVKKILDIELDKKDISVRNGTLYVKAQPALKSELFMRRKQITDEMRVLLEKKTPNDIR